MAITKEEHQAVHQELHGKLDLLLADFFRHHPSNSLQKTTLLELVVWSHQQVLEPTEIEGE